MTYYFSNNAVTTLDGPVANGSVTTFTVVDGTSFPIGPIFIVKIGDELIEVIGQSDPQTWFVNRGVEGTTGVAYSGGETVTHVLTAGVVDAIQFTDVKAQEAVGDMISDTDTINLTYTGTPNLYADVKVQKSITSDSSGIKLVGDESSPAADQYYGTDSGSSLGFHDLPSGGGVAINDIGDATGAGSVALGSNSFEITAGGVQALNITSSMGAPDITIGGTVLIGSTGGYTSLTGYVSVGNSSSAVTCGAAGGTLAFNGCTPVGLQTMPLNSDDSGAGLQSSFNTLLAKLNTLGLVGIDI
ncbi:hypothetical protein [Anatilimnocola floriformis]|uniref:hypothetical protein n=1 Tax=Anatilimnocola floriformis TaxID=2948575 RepID=UPI0020C35677|nr:hypothetical protein [Anatilimnocola floriformis]